MSHSPQHASPRIPAESLEIPEITTNEVADWRSLQPGYLVSLPDEQHVLVCTLDTSSGPHAGLTGVRVAAPPSQTLPLGETLRLNAKELDTACPLYVLGAWYAAKGTPKPEQVLLEAIRRGLITVHTCGVPWPLADTMQLTTEATARIEQYLFEVARSSGCAFPFHDIAQAFKDMRFCPRPENPSLCDILTAEELSRHRKAPDADLLSFWARELRRRIHSSDWLPPLL